MKTLIIFFLLSTVSMDAQNAIPDANGGNSKFTKSYKYYRIVDANSDSGWLALTNEITFNVGSNYDIKTSDLFERTHTYQRIGKTEEIQIGDSKGWKNYYSIEGEGKIEFWTLRIGTVIKSGDIIAVYTNVTDYFPNSFFY
jgi:hypothetical protein